MDLSSAFKTEVYRPVVTIVIPGLVALAPYAYIVSVYYPAIFNFATEHPFLTSVINLLVVIAAGFLLEDIGSLIESRVWEPLQKDQQKLMDEWYEYLRLAFETEPLGQKYISAVVMRMKFELAFSLALLICAPGLLFLKLGLGIDFPAFSILFGIFAVVTYLLWESFNSSKLLRKTRHELLKGITLIGKPT